jgi:hypothetical protein
MEKTSALGRGVSRRFSFGRDGGAIENGVTVDCADSIACENDWTGKDLDCVVVLDDGDGDSYAELGNLKVDSGSKTATSSSSSSAMTMGVVGIEEEQSLAEEEQVEDLRPRIVDAEGVFER